MGSPEGGCYNVQISQVSENKEVRLRSAVPQVRADGFGVLFLVLLQAGQLHILAAFSFLLQAKLSLRNLLVGHPICFPPAMKKIFLQNVFAHDISDEGLITKLYKELIQLSNIK